MYLHSSVTASRPFSQEAPIALLVLGSITTPKTCLSASQWACPEFTTAPSVSLISRAQYHSAFGAWGYLPGISGQVCYTGGSCVWQHTYIYTQEDSQDVALLPVRHVYPSHTALTSTALPSFQYSLLRLPTLSPCCTAVHLYALFTRYFQGGDVCNNPVFLSG